MQKNQESLETRIQKQTNLASMLAVQLIGNKVD